MDEEHYGDVDGIDEDDGDAAVDMVIDALASKIDVGWSWIPFRRVPPPDPFWRWGFCDF